ncbi:MAG TPA: STAS domain-containing protein [Thiolinea sp.]|nr:STAS domain-containing protein [Thiolinea sp.]
MKASENSIRIARQADHTVITLQGVMDQELASNLVPLVSKVAPSIVFDMRQVAYVTAAGSRVILGYYQSFGVKPVLRQANQSILELLDLTGTLNYVSLAEDEPASTPT